MKKVITILTGLIICFLSQAQTYFGQQDIISLGVTDAATEVCAGDLDGDGDMDVLSGSDYDTKIAWYENLDGSGNFGVQQIISSSASHVSSLYAVDIDGDNDNDVLSCAWCANEIGWYENLDGCGIFGPKKIITAALLFGSDAYAEDLDGDGDLDVISASRDDGQIAWYENLDGHGNFGGQLIISTLIEGAKSVYAEDLDGDGDIDIISGAYWGDFIAWHENIDGAGTYAPPQIISDLVNDPQSVYAEDLDGDADIDILSASQVDGKIAWYENNDGEGSFGAQQIISNTVTGANSVITSDLDNDGDLDVLATSMNDDQVIWFENTDGNGNFGDKQIITGCTDFASSVFAADIDGDNDLDVLSSSYNDDKIAWYQNYTLDILTQPQSLIVCPNHTAYFSTIAKDATGYQWQVNTGSGFFDLTNNDTYSGTTTNVLIIASAIASMSGFQYRCRVSNLMADQYSNAATLTVTDIECPVISSTHSNHSVEADNDCETILADFTRYVIATDNCDDHLDIVQTPGAGSHITGAVNTITLTATDDSKNNASVSFNMEVLDNTAPVIICPENITIELEQGQDTYIVKGNELAPVFKDDNCEIESMTNNLNNSETLEMHSFTQGTKTTIIWTIKDNSNNLSECSFNLSIYPYRGILIFPNPTTGNVFIEFYREDATKIRLFDVGGKSILEKKVTQQKENINLFSLSSGIYFIQVLTENDVINSKIVKME